jgi:hypothetical protein
MLTETSALLPNVIGVTERGDRRSALLLICRVAWPLIDGPFTSVSSSSPFVALKVKLEGITNWPSRKSRSPAVSAMDCTFVYWMFAGWLRASAPWKLMPPDVGPAAEQVSAF